MKLREYLMTALYVFYSALSINGSATAATSVSPTYPTGTDALPIVVHQNERSTWKSPPGTYWIPDTSFRIIDYSAAKDGAPLVARLFGGIGAAAWAGSANKATEDKAGIHSPVKVVDLDKLTSQALQLEFRDSPSHAILQQDGVDKLPAFVASPLGTFSLRSGADASLSILVEVSMLDAEKQVVWRKKYNYGTGAIKPISEAGWLSQDEDALAKVSERAVAKIAYLIRHDIEHLPYPQEKDIQIDTSKKECEPLKIIKKMTLLETEGEMLTIRTDLGEKLGSSINVSPKSNNTCLIFDKQ